MAGVRREGLIRTASSLESDVIMADPDRIYRLLIVDDDETDRRQYARHLARRAPGQFEIEQAADAAAGILALSRRTFDCVLLDFNLPDHTGREFLSAAMIGGQAPAAFVLIAGEGSETIALNALQLGAQDYLVKDQLTEGRLWQAIVQAISRRELRQTLADSIGALTAANTSMEQEIIARTNAGAAWDVVSEAAEQTVQARTRFVGTMMRELDTLLNGILGHAQLMRCEGGLSDRQNALTGAMMQSGRHTLRMVGRVLDFCAVEPEEIAPRPMTLSVRELSEDCIGRIGPLADARGLRLDLVSSHGSPRQIVADPARLRQVLLNLLGNAVKFTTAGSVELRILAAASPTILHMEVSDTGPGIEESGRLFPDFGHPIGLPVTEEGAGPGLAIAARFVALMGGTIGYRANPSGGSIFWLELPVDDRLSRTGAGSLTETRDVA